MTIIMICLCAAGLGLFGWAVYDDLFGPYAEATAIDRAIGAALLDGRISLEEANRLVKKHVLPKLPPAP